MKKINLSQVDKTFRKLRNFNSVVLPRLGHEVVNFSKERFVQKKWLGANVQPWKNRPRPDHTHKKRTRPKKGSTLVASGRLKRSIQIIKNTTDCIIIGTDVPYAKVHNEGLHIRGTRNIKAHQRKQKARTENVRNHTRKVGSSSAISVTVKAHQRKQKARTENVKSHTRKVGSSSATSVTVKAHTRKRKARTENVRNHTRKVDYEMEKRQFLPNSLAQSPVLEKRLQDLVDREMKKILK